MAIELTLNYGKKVGLPGYSSHNCSVSLKTELNSINDVPAEVHELYRLLQESVDAEIRNPGYLPASNGNGSTHSNGTNGNGSHGDQPWQCSLKQQKLVMDLVEQNGIDKQQIELLAQERFGKGIRQLNKLEMSSIIDELFERYPNRKNGTSGSNGRYRGVPQRRTSYAGRT